MSLCALFSDISAHLTSPEFLKSARHPEHPTAFTRKRKLPLPSLVALLLCGMRLSVQAELNQFFAHLRQQAQLVHHVTEQAFAQARAKLSATSIPLLNDWVIQRAQHYGFVPLWQGLRLVAADASTMRFGVRASHVKRPALADQIAFSLFLPTAELMLATSLYSVRDNNERQMLFEHLDLLSSSDLLLMDRGYPCCWLVSVLNQRSLAFCMRVEKSGNGNFACVRDFLRNGLTEQIVKLSAPDRRDASDYACPREPQTVRLVRHIAPNGAVRVLMTNLMDMQRFPAACFGDLYHQRWGIEEAFKRLKHRLNLEHVSGLSQQAVVQDVAAKILCDNLQVFTSMVAHERADLPESVRINHAHAHTVLKPLLPGLLLATSVGKLLREVLRLIAKKTYRHRHGVSKPRKSRPKPHKYMTQKNC
jgi:hypothetical protein